MTPEFRQLQIRTMDAERALYTFCELKDYNIDFTVKRLYFFSPKHGQSSTQHAHYEEKEVFVIARGTAVAVIDDGNGKREIQMKAPGDAIYVGNLVWHGFLRYSDDALVIALSSTNHDPNMSDYIREYDAWQKYMEKQAVQV